MDNPIELDIEALKNAFKSLKKAYEIFSAGSSEPDMCDIYADSCVKRFEYTFETAWKIMKKYFKLQYNKSEEELTMNNIFRYMEGYGFTDSWLKWKEYYAKRIDIEEGYSVKKTKELLSIVSEFIKDTDLLLNKLIEKDLVKV